MEKKRRTFNPEFKLQMVQLFKNGKSRKDIIHEYNLTLSALDKWIKDYDKTCSFKHQDNLSEDEKELKRLRKENKQLRMETDIFKASSADHGTKIKVIRQNNYQYSVSAMCKILKICRSSYYYEVNVVKRAEKEAQEHLLTENIISIFNKSRKCYGSRKVREVLKTKGLVVSRRKIIKIMKSNGLISLYNKARYKHKKQNYNEQLIDNRLNRKFNRKHAMEVTVSDLTYVKVANKWHYICLFVDLFNREIIGVSTGRHKSADLVLRALSSIKGDLHNVSMFHTDRGKEFNNACIEEALTTIDIQRSLSIKGCPYDNAIAESTFKAVKTEFIYPNRFRTLDELNLQLSDYINWFNHHRIHGSLNYQTPVNYKLSTT
ncbi:MULTISPECIES: IS3 family transposase [Staphylococcus]|uniref:IS3 family transposase n=1 Tax=Staphylococcus TaxID=1279 RepID=UPI00194E228C|nr:MULTISPECIES: IS3 family transposase [Staphylococcus]MDG4944221.1 IS3 family transposase [Staphylococcus agnetis]